jgi:hypothetical protein
MNPSKYARGPPHVACRISAGPRRAGPYRAVQGSRAHGRRNDLAGYEMSSS